MTEPEQAVPSDERLMFAFRATKPDGAAVIDRIQAASSKDAWSKLERRGYTAIRLLDDEITAIKLDSAPSARQLVFSAAEQEALRKRGGFVPFFFGLLLHRNNLAIWAPLAAWLGYNAWTRGFPSPATTLPLTLLTAYALWFVWASVPRVLYRMALEASAWARWDEVLRWMHFLGTWKRWFRTPMPDHELRFRTATAEAALGRMSDALARVAPLEYDPSLRPGFYHSRLASLYIVTRDYAQAAVLQHESRKRNPTDTATVDLAFTLARRLRNHRDAQALLNQVDEAKRTPVGLAFLYFCRAHIALDSGTPEQACACFARGLELIRKNVGIPIIKPIVADARAHYALALAAVGRTAEAAPHVAAVRPMLIAWAEHDLLARCEAALG